FAVLRRPPSPRSSRRPTATAFERRTKSRRRNVGPYKNSFIASIPSPASTRSTNTSSTHSNAQAASPSSANLASTN
ncbi:unnamed protein product, partial [Aphanomyces euteiches]